MRYDRIILGTDNDDTLDDSSLLAGETGLIRGLAGNDTITATKLGTDIVAGDGDDIIAANGGDISCGLGFDQVTGTSAFETVRNILGECIVDIGANGLVKAGAGSGLFFASEALGDTNETLFFGQQFTSSLTFAFIRGNPVDINTGVAQSQATGFNHFISGSGNDEFFGAASGFLELRSLGGDDYISVEAETVDITAGRGDDTVDLAFDEVQSASVDMGTGVDRLFCGSGLETIDFRGYGKNVSERAFTYVFDFDTAEDAIQLGPRMSLDAFRATARESVDSSGTITGLQFDTRNGDSLFLAGLTLAQLDDIAFLT